MIKRIVTALELIASELKQLREETQAIRLEQKDYMDLSKQEAEKGPVRIMEMFERFKTLAGGKGDGS
jgi:hypothetical protein